MNTHPTLVSSYALHTLSEAEKSIMRAKVSDSVFRKFIEAQIREAQLRLLEFSPDTELSAEEFRSVYRDFRLAWLFWHQFKDFVDDWSENFENNFTTKE